MMECIGDKGGRGFWLCVRSVPDTSISFTKSVKFLLIELHMAEGSFRD
jgi:hypothetical protein